jgi:hypothetical protein
MISGYVVIHRAIAGDYCVREAILSMLPICDEVVVGYGTSDDGTGEMLADLAAKHSKIRIEETPWFQPVGKPRWFVEWLNRTRLKLRGKFQITLDADEVLDDSEYTHRIIKDAARRNVPLWFHRINYIHNVRTVIAHGETCGVNVVRCGPQNLFMPSDEPYPTRQQEPMIRKLAEEPNPLPIIHHFGFLRTNSGMFAKSKVGLQAFFGGYDPRLEEAEKHPDKHWTEFCQHQRPFTSYDGPVPAVAHAWLKERGAM